MNHYFTIEAATARDVIQACRGTDDKNSLADPVPDDAAATGTFQLPSTMDANAAQDAIGNMFSTLATGNPGHRLLVRLDSDNLITYWMTPLA